MVSRPCLCLCLHLCVCVSVLFVFSLVSQLCLGGASVCLGDVSVFVSVCVSVLRLSLCFGGVSMVSLQCDGDASVVFR